MSNTDLKQYLQTQITQTLKKLKGLSHDIDDKPLFRRTIFNELHQHALNFLTKNTNPRFIVMPGLRGTGKTTLLAQLYLSLPNENITKLYLSVDEAIKRFEVNLWDIIENYEELIEKHLEDFNTPLFLFIDEIHYDEKWAMFLKTLYDRSKNIMVFCTGSAALLLREQINADVARRVFFIDVPPISFSEYMLFKYNKPIINEVGNIIKKAIVFSNDAKNIFNTLKAEEKRINKYWQDISKFELYNYIKFGTFPFTLKAENEIVATTFISQIINKVIYADIPQFYNFEATTLNKIDKLLYLLADTLGVSNNKLCDVLEMKADTLRLIFKSLENSGVINKIAPFGGHFKQVKKQAKYLFATPALRFVYLSSKESISIFENYLGSLLEDLVSMYLQRLIPLFGNFALSYDAADSGADFIISSGLQHIIIEVGAGKKNYKQTFVTAQKVKSKYSLIISDDSLEYSAAQNAIKIPLKYFLLS